MCSHCGYSNYLWVNFQIAVGLGYDNNKIYVKCMICVQIFSSGQNFPITLIFVTTTCTYKKCIVTIIRM